MDKVKRILIISADDKLKDVLNFCFDGWGYEVFLRTSPKNEATVDDIETVKRVSPDVVVVDVQSARKKQLDICRMLKDNFVTAFIPIITLINKRQLRTHLLSLKQGVDDYLIKPPDPLDLRIRIEMTIRRVQHSIQANPLTGLPGGRILEDVLKEKLKKKIPFSFGYVDIDNFKCFNDVYGYQKGDKVLLQTAHMLLFALKKFGNKDDFISHIGGDDFAFVSTPDKYEQISHSFVHLFDDVIPFHCSRGERKRGFMIARDRTRKIRKIPLMSISVAIVNNDGFSDLKNIIEVNERIVEIKRYLKTIPQSKFMVDRRDTELAVHNVLRINKKRNEDSSYMPLGQMLLEENLVSSEQLDEALAIHWKRGVVLGGILKELGFLNEKELQKVLSAQGIIQEDRNYKLQNPNYNQ